jgi:cytoskeletal protein CcmA (bactofilin family)
MRSRTKNSRSESNKIEQAPVAREQVPETRQSVIGASLQFTGEIKSAGSVRIEGRVTGRVTARSLTLGRSGGIEGDVAAEIAQIDGLVEGDLEADTVILGPSAQVFGDITHRSLSMEPGARFEGRSILARAETSAGETPPEASVE